MAWHWPGDKPLSEPMMVRSLVHICVIRPQWVNSNLTESPWKFWHGWHYIPLFDNCCNYLAMPLIHASRASSLDELIVDRLKIVQGHILEQCLLSYNELLHHKYHKSWVTEWLKFKDIWTPKRKDRQFDNFVITGGTVSCLKNNLRCHQWWQLGATSDDKVVKLKNLCFQWRPWIAINESWDYVYFHFEISLQWIFHQTFSWPQIFSWWKSTKLKEIKQELYLPSNGGTLDTFWVCMFIVSHM